MKKLALTSFVLLVLSLILISNVYSASYYLSPTGSDSYNGLYPTYTGGINGPWLSFHHADGNLSAGDTLYCRGGIYTATNDYFRSSSNGTQTSPISIRNYPGETPVFRATGVNQSGIVDIVYITHDWHVFEGLEFRPTDSTAGCAHAFYLNGADHNTFTNITFVSALRSSDVYTVDGSIFHVRSSTYNEWDSCTLYGAGDHGSSQGQSGNLIIFWGSGNTHNKVHDCDLQMGCHDIVRIDSANGYNEVYDNTITHARGYGVYFYIGSSRNIAERNSIKECNEGLSYTKCPIFNCGSDNIVRNNVCWDSGKYGLGFSGGDYSKIYNNVFYNNDSSGFWLRYQYDTPEHNRFINNVIAHNMVTESWGSYYGEVSNPFTDGFFNTAHDNQFKYNFIVAYVSGAWQDDYTDVVENSSNIRKVSYMETNYSTWSNNIYNYCDPKFTNAGTGDFTLQAGSCLIDAGTTLTQANGSGSNSKSLVVDDAGWFWYSSYDGSGDQIAIGDVNTVRIITAINYSTNVITLDSAASWSDNANIYLYSSFSDSNTVLFSGSAPDIGAYEYIGAPAPPKNLRLVKYLTGSVSRKSLYDFRILVDRFTENFTINAVYGVDLRPLS